MLIHRLRVLPVAYIFPSRHGAALPGFDEQRGFAATTSKAQVEQGAYWESRRASRSQQCEQLPLAGVRPPRAYGRYAGADRGSSNPLLAQRNLKFLVGFSLFLEIQIICSFSFFLHVESGPVVQLDCGGAGAHANSRGSLFKRTVSRH